MALEVSAAAELTQEEKNNQLLLEVGGRNVLKVQQLIDSKADINAEAIALWDMGRYSTTPLNEAIRRKNTCMVELLLKNNANPHQYTISQVIQRQEFFLPDYISSEQTVLHGVAALDNVPLAQLLCEYGANMYLRAMNGYEIITPGESPVHVAARSGSCAVLAFFLAHESSHKQTMSDTITEGFTSMASACFEPNIVKIIMDYESPGIKIFKTPSVDDRQLIKQPSRFHCEPLTALGSVEKELLYLHQQLKSPSCDKEKTELLIQKCTQAQLLLQKHGA